MTQHFFFFFIYWKSNKQHQQQKLHLELLCVHDIFNLSVSVFSQFRNSQAYNYCKLKQHLCWYYSFVDKFAKYLLLDNLFRNIFPAFKSSVSKNWNGNGQKMKEIFTNFVYVKQEITFVLYKWINLNTDEFGQYSTRLISVFVW